MATLMKSRAHKPISEGSLAFSWTSRGEDSEPTEFELLLNEEQPDDGKRYLATFYKLKLNRAEMRALKKCLDEIFEDESLKPLTATEMRQRSFIGQKKNDE